MLRKLSLGALFISLSLLLSSCVHLKGDVGVNSAARFNGEITYTLDKLLLSLVGISSLAELNSRQTEGSAELGFCKGILWTEDATKYIFKCALQDASAETNSDITASVIGTNIVLRYKGNLDPSPTDSNPIELGSVSLTIRFIDPVLSYRENKVGLVQKVDSLTYRISGTATEPMDIEIVANCASRCGTKNNVPIPTPAKTINPLTDADNATDAALEATDAAYAATDAANIAAEAADAATAAAEAATEAAQSISNEGSVNAQALDLEISNILRKLQEFDGSMKQLMTRLIKK